MLRRHAAARPPAACPDCRRRRCAEASVPAGRARRRAADSRCASGGRERRPACASARLARRSPCRGCRCLRRPDSRTTRAGGRESAPWDRTCRRQSRRPPCGRASRRPGGSFPCCPRCRCRHCRSPRQSRPPPGRCSESAAPGCGGATGLGRARRPSDCGTWRAAGAPCGGWRGLAGARRRRHRRRSGSRRAAAGARLSPSRPRPAVRRSARECRAG